MDKILASNEIKKFINMFKSLSSVAEDLEKLGGIEQALKEKKISLKSFEDEKESLAQEIKKMHDSIVSIKDVYALKEAELKKSFNESSATLLLEHNKFLEDLDAKKEKEKESLFYTQEKEQACLRNIQELDLVLEEKQKALDAVMKKLEQIKGSI